MAVVMTRCGKLPSENMYSGKCSTCKSEYDAKKGDLKYESDYRDSSYTTKCQLTGCGNTVYFYPKPPQVL